MLTSVIHFFRELAATITWPVAVLIIAILFRRQLLLALKIITGRIETANKFSITKDGITFEQLKQKVADVEKKTDEVERKTEDAQETLQAIAGGGGVGGNKNTDASTQITATEISRSMDEIEPDTSADANDPQKGKWGGSPKNNSRELRATVTELPGNVPLYRIQLEVMSTNVLKPLTGKVVFYLHPSFPKDKQEVGVKNGRALLGLLSYGSFTAGAQVFEDDGVTLLELDLATIPGVSEHFMNT